MTSWGLQGVRGVLWNKAPVLPEVALGSDDGLLIVQLTLL